MSIELINISVKDQDTNRLEEITTLFEHHSITICIGQTGSGKSTLLDSVAGLIPIASGSVIVDGIPLWKGKKLADPIMQRFGSVFQYPEHQLFSRTVQGEFVYSLRPLRLSHTEIEERIGTSLTQMDLPKSITSSSPFRLSGGQKRRVALATTFATYPEWLLLDEPSAGLDLDSTKQLCEFIVEFKSKNPNGGVIIATHDLDVFLPIADSVLLLNHGQIIKHVPATELYLHPEWLCEIGIALPPSLSVQAGVRQCGVPLPARHILPEEMADYIYKQLNLQTQTVFTPPIPHASNHMAKGSVKKTASIHSSVNSVDPRVKWLICMFLSTAILLQTNWIGILASLGLTGLTLLCSRVRISVIWKYSKSFIALIALSMMLSALQFGKDAKLGGFHGIGLSLHPAILTFKSLAPILCVVEFGLLLSVTTTTEELKQSLNQLLSPIQVRGLPIAAFTLSASLLLRFIPMILRELTRFARIARARGKRNTKFGQISFLDLPAVMIPLLISILQLAEDLSQAMEARGYKHAGQKMSNIRILSMRTIDRVVLSCAGVITILFIFIRFI